MKEGCFSGTVGLLVLVVSFGDCRASCSGETTLIATRYNRTLTSPHYPSDYENNLHCRWRLTADIQTDRILLYVADLDLQSAHRCSYDNLSIYDGDEPSRGRQLAVLCGSDGGQHFNSSGQDMFIQFVADGAIARKGFKLVYRALQQTRNSTTSSSGDGDGAGDQPVLLLASPYRVHFLESANYPSQYSSHVVKIWRIRCSSGFVVRLHVEDMDLQDSNMCAENKVSVLDPDSGKKLGTMCSNMSVRVELHSTGQSMTVIFSSGVAHEGRGFRLRYLAVRSSKAWPLHTTTHSAWSRNTAPSESDRTSVLSRYTPIVIGAVGGCLLLFLFVTILCTLYFRNKQWQDPNAGPPRPSTAVFPTRRGNRDHEAASRHHTNPAFSTCTEAPPPYSSLQHGPRLPQPLSALALPNPLQPDIVAPPSYSESMMMTHPPGRTKVINGDAPPTQSVDPAARAALSASNGAPAGDTAPPHEMESVL